jgi:DNA integrity scanning protein DisA with diadenylate cyclase activity
MARYKKRTEEELKELKEIDFGDLMALADVTRALAAAQKEVQYARDELIAKLYEVTSDIVELHLVGQHPWLVEIQAPDSGEPGEVR